MLKRFIILILILFSASALWYYFFYNTKSISIVFETTPKATVIVAKVIETVAVEKAELPPLEVPTEVKGIYITAYTALTPYLMDNLIYLIKTTDLNSMIINVKDSDRVFLGKNMANLVKRLRENNIYPIARIVIFQDNQLVKDRPDLALKNQDESLWGKKGYRWVDPSSREVWDYNAEVSVKALDMGFLEINFDYIRFPDGDINDILYPFYDYSKLKLTVIKEAAEYITSKIKAQHPDSLISVDVFAYSFLRTHGLGIGQRLVDLVDYFDVIAPMIYPSHYGAGNFGFENPAEEPYQVVYQTITEGVWQVARAEKQMVVRPWIQDFNIGAVYNREFIQAQIKAVEDALGDQYQGWMSWNPNNTYKKEKYKKAAEKAAAAASVQVN